MRTTSIDWNAALGRHHYHGRAFGWIALAVLGAINLFRGSIHLFAEDGGAGRIAGIDLSQGGEVILTLFAAAGLTQLLMAAIDFSVAFRFRALVPVVLAYHLVQQIGGALIVWVWRPLPVPAPGKYGAVALIPVVALALWVALRRPREVSVTTAEPSGQSAS